MTSLPDTAEGERKIVVETPTDTFVLRGRPCELSAFSYVADKKRDIPAHLTYFNTGRPSMYPPSVYDRMYLVDYGYDQSLERDDRQHSNSRGLNVNCEERARKIPALSSSMYGHGLNQEQELDKPVRAFCRKDKIKSEFFRSNGVNLQPEMDSALAKK